MTEETLLAIQAFHQAVLDNANAAIESGRPMNVAHLKALTETLRNVEVSYKGNAHVRLREAAEENKLRNAAVKAEVERQVGEIQTIHAAELAKLREEHQAAMHARPSERDKALGLGDVVQITPLFHPDPYYDRWRIYSGCQLVVSRIDAGTDFKQVLGYLQNAGKFGQPGAVMWVEIPRDYIARIGHAEWKRTDIR